MFHAHDATAFPRPRGHVRAALGDAGRRRVESHLAACPRHRPTPLVALPGLARALGLASLHVKDEGRRLGLGSFKALGGAYAVMRIVLDAAAAATGRPVAPDALQTDAVRAVASGITVACATDGNHGRSVAAGARLAGCRAVIFLHGGVSTEREAAIARFGAEIRRVDVTYDESIAAAARQAAASGWIVVSDTVTGQGDDEAVPLLVMQGYTVLAGEAFDGLDRPPTHLFLQAGVGGMAGAVALHAAQRYGDAAPRVVVVEPERAACLFESARAGRPVTIPHGEPTVMAMLECCEPSLLAWEILAHHAQAFVTLPEASAVEVMRLLGRPVGGDPAIVSGESGGVGLSGLLACLRDPLAVAALGLGADSRVLVVNSEGATDPALFESLTGLDPASVAAGQA